jgi:hypothetical protein
MNEEFWKQFVGSLARKLLTLIAGILIAKWGVSQEIVDSVTSDATVAVVAGFLILIAGIIWSWAKTKFNINFVNVAATASPASDIGEVKQIAKQQSTFQTSI